MGEVAGILLLAVVVLAIWVASLRCRLRPCERCKSTGSTEPFRGTDAYPHFYRRPLDLCELCANAQREFLSHRFMLETEARMRFGREKLVKAAQEDWGDKAVDMVALLLVARQDFDMARRLLTAEAFELVKPWLKQNLRAG